MPDCKQKNRKLNSNNQKLYSVKGIGKGGKPILK